MAVGYLGESGIVLGEFDPEGVEWTWSGNDPWSPSPAPREVVGDRETGHGSWDATSYYGPRTLPVDGLAYGSHETLHRAKHRLMAACSVSPFLFRVIEPGFDRQAMVRRGGEVLWTEDTPTKASWSVALYQPDPFIYGTAIHEASTGLPESTGGLTWPLAWGATWDSTVASGHMTAHNEGTVEAFPVFRVYGPLSDFGVVHLNAGHVLSVSNPVGETLAAGEFIELDMATRRVLLMGTGSRRSWVSGRFFGLPPGDSDIGFTSSTPNTTALVTMTWRDTYI